MSLCSHALVRGCQEAFKDILSLFQNSFAFCFHLGKCDFSFAIEYTLISHKSSGRENTCPKIRLIF